MVEGYNILSFLEHGVCQKDFESSKYLKIIEISSLTVLLLMTTTARKMDFDQGNWTNFEEQAKQNFMSSFHETDFF